MLLKSLFESSAQFAMRKSMRAYLEQNLSMVALKLCSPGKEFSTFVDDNGDFFK